MSDLRALWRAAMRQGWVLLEDPRLLELAPECERCTLRATRIGPTGRGWCDTHAPTGATAPGQPEQIERIRDLAASGASDPEIGEALGVSGAWVYRLRSRAGIPAGRPYRTDWESTIRDMHARGLTTRQIAAESEYHPNTVRQLLSRLGLRAHRPGGDRG